MSSWCSLNIKPHASVLTKFCQEKRLTDAQWEVGVDIDGYGGEVRGPANMSGPVGSIFYTDP